VGAVLVPEIYFKVQCFRFEFESTSLNEECCHVTVCLRESDAVGARLQQRLEEGDRTYQPRCDDLLHELQERHTDHAGQLRHCDRRVCTSLHSRVSTSTKFAEHDTCTRYQSIVQCVIGPIPWGHSGPLCHALSLLSSWTSMRRRRATVAAVATPGERQCKTARSSEWAQHFSNASCYVHLVLWIHHVSM